MKKPRTYKELLELVSPKDLLNVLDFSGVNDMPGTIHWDIKREFSKHIWESIKDHREKEPRYVSKKLNNTFYETVIKCIQDFYRWSREFNHPHSHIFKRVINALNIDINEIKKIMDKK